MPTYYFSNTDGNDTRTAAQAQSSATPWKTLAKHNSTSITGANTFLFKRGDTFPGFIISKDGAPGSPVNYGAYGTGNAPVITGLINLTAWTLSSGKIYYASLDVPYLQIVTIDGVLKGMGRYPKTGYLTYNNTRVATPITGAAIGAIPFNPTGAEAVVRKDRYYVDRQRVLSRSGNTLNLDTTDWTLGRNDQAASNLNGFFIQDSINTLTADGDWFYNKAEKRLYVYFNAGPTGRTVNAAGYLRGMEANNRSNVNVTGLKFEGYNSTGVWLNYGNTFNISNNFFDKIGGIAIEGLEGNGGITVSGNEISNCYNGGINFYTVDNVQILNNKVDSIHLIMGMGNSGDAAGNGIAFKGDYNTVRGNTVTNIGFNGISWYLGNHILVEQNKVDNYCLLKDDGAGIYNYGIFAQTFLDRIVQDNIILNGIGNPEGLGAYSDQNYGFALGIYLDNYASEITVRRNEIQNAEGGGIFLNTQIKNAVISDNEVYNTRRGLMILNDGQIRLLTVTGNKFIAKTASQLTMYIEPFNGATAQDIVNFGTFNNNVYARPIAEGQTIQIGGNFFANYSVATWKSAFGKDAASKASQVLITDINDFKPLYNVSAGSVVAALTAKYRDVSGTIYDGSINLPAYGGAVLMYYSPTTAAPVTPKTKKILVKDGAILSDAGQILYVEE